jgi:hypothetical protein
MRPRFTKFGLSEVDVPFAKHFEYVAKSWGWTPAQVEAAFAWYARRPTDATNDESRARLLEDFQSFAASSGLPDAEVDVAMAWHGTVSERGIENLPVPPDPQGDQLASDLAYIRRLRQQDPDAYDNDPELQAAERALIAADLEGGAAPGGAPSPAAARLAEIRELRRNDPDAYDSNAALRAEELSLLESAQPAAPAAPASAPANNGGANGDLLTTP